MAKKQKSEVRIQNSEERTAGAAVPEETLEFSVVREGVPTYTLHADTRWGMMAMLMLYRLVREWDAPLSLQFEVERVMREFEFWEEDHRGDPAA